MATGFYWMTNFHFAPPGVELNFTLHKNPKNKGWDKFLKKYLFTLLYNKADIVYI